MRCVEEKEYKLGNGRVVKAYYDENHIAGVTQEFFEQILVPALEKQIPKKPLYEITKDYEGNFCDGIFKCSCCGRTICMEIEGNYNLNYPYCNCGQAIDWGGTK